MRSMEHVLGRWTPQGDGHGVRYDSALWSGVVDRPGLRTHACTHAGLGNERGGEQCPFLLKGVLSAILVLLLRT